MPGRGAFPLSASRSLDEDMPAMAGEEVPVPESYGTVWKICAHVGRSTV